VGFALRLSPGFRALRRSREPFVRAHGGGAAVEFAIIGPMLLLILSGIFTYGGYFLTAHTVQQITNDAARAALAGLDDEERSLLAREAAEAGIRGQAFMRGDLSRLDVARSGAALSIAVTYDASDDMYWSLQALLPVPSPNISRTATIRLGGF
jgi:Flp pilus assembly protein TadG